jgi:CheY-like chemotaxis protein
MGHKILLADDSITVQKIVKLTFSDEGIEVVAVSNGELALQQLQDWQPDLVMADVFMPGRDGYEVCQFIKTNPQMRHIPVLLLVHAFEPFDQGRAEQVQSDGHLTKPFHSIRTLVTTVRELIQNGAKSAYPAAAPAPVHKVSAASVSAAPESFQPESRKLNDAESDSGQVIQLQPQAEAETFSEPQPTVPVSLDSLPLPGTEFTESTELLSISAAGDFNQNFNSFSAQPEPLPEPETISLLAAPETTTAEPETFPVESHATSSALPGVELSESVQAEVSFTDRAASDEAAGEVLDLEEVLPQVSFGQVGEMELLSEALPPQPGVAFAAPLAEPETLPVLAEVVTSDDSRFSLASESTGDVLEDSDSVSQVFSAQPESSAPVGLEVLPVTSFDDLPEISQPTSVEIAAAPETMNEEMLPVLAAENFSGAATADPAATLPLTNSPAYDLIQSRDFGVGQVIAEPDAMPEPLSAQTASTAETEKSCEPQSTFEAAAHKPDEFAVEQPAKQDTATGVVASSFSQTGSDAQSVSPALIDEIVNRVVARLSEKAIQEIAWEVVPEMAEIIIRKQLAEKSH